MHDWLNAGTDPAYPLDVVSGWQAPSYALYVCRSCQIAIPCVLSWRVV